MQIIINACTFFISAFSECFLIIPRVNKPKDELNFNLFKKDFMDGIKFTFSNNTATSLVTLAMMLNFALGAAQIGQTFISKQILMLSDFQYGLTHRIPASVIFALSGILTILPVIFYRKVLLSVKLNDSTNVVADSSN